MVREKLSPETSIWGWKLLIISSILGFLFMVVFYLAVTNDPEYMPSHQQKHTQQHSFKTAPAMSPVAEQPNNEAPASDDHSATMHMSEHNQ